ncbi:response regulator transcription factor [Mangrovimonas cancribranchiae]|uniref:Response regulator transcription factor n=1 Tax=Mangrovimonas cancribranchiae TaxID=3080055 RepID=A0AAU6NXY3_9FLAO
MKKPSIIIADDHPLILKGLEDFLKERHYNVLDSAKNGKQAYQLIEDLQPDIAILDIQMPYLTGLQIAEKCKNNQFNTKIIIITFEKDESIYNQAKSLGIYGYVLKEFALTEIENCIASILENTSYFSPELLSHLEKEQVPEELKLLTPTEKEVLKLTAKSKTAKEIGDILFVSKRTVEKHKSNISKKLKLDCKDTSLALFAKEIEAYL